jgi:multiple antibiotic resistance protein
MAVPLISGPGAIGLVIGLAAEDPQWSNYLGGLLGIALLGITLYQGYFILNVSTIW